MTARRTMFKLSIGDTPHTLSDSDFKQLGDRAEGYSGADVTVVVRDAIMAPVRKVQSATHFRQVSTGSRASDS